VTRKTLAVVASLPFPDASFDLVVSTLSMHHWADGTAGLAQIRRVLRPGGRAPIWDFRAGGVPFHGGRREPLATETYGLEVVNVTPWRWPWRLALLERIEFARSDVTDHDRRG
jgi:ubiquinone/menaquinone biosynthesis C-methylase UbiE